MISALKKAGISPEPKYSELARVGHGSGGPAYAKSELLGMAVCPTKSPNPIVPRPVRTYVSRNHPLLRGGWAASPEIVRWTLVSYTDGLCWVIVPATVSTAT